MKRATLGLLGTLSALAITAAPLGARLPRSAAAPARDNKVTITVFDWGNLGSSSSSPAADKQAVLDYEKLHPNVVIKPVALPNADPQVYNETNFAAGTAQDILAPIYTQAIYDDLPKNYWLEITPYLQQPNRYVPGNKHWIDIFEPSINQQNAFAGNRYYVVSWQAQDATFFYNKGIFAKAGITHTPTTWAELIADAAAIKKAGYIPDLYWLGDTYPIGENGSIISLIENQVMSKTLQKLDANHDGTVDIKELVYGIKHRIYSPMNADYQEAWKLYKDWSQYWEPNAAAQKGPYTGAGGAAALAPFFNGKVGMVYNGQWGLVNLAQIKTKLNWGVFKFPQITTASSAFATPGVKGVGIWGAWNAVSFGIPTSTKTRGHLDVALDFLQYISAPKVSAPLALVNGTLPVTRGFTPSTPVQSLFYDLLKHPTMQFAAEASLGSKWLRDRISTQQAYITGVESLDQAMSDMQRYTDQAATRAIKTYGLSIQ